MLIQVVPVQQIGTALSQGQWTEEINHNVESADDISPKFFLPGHSNNHSFDAEARAAFIYIHFSDLIPVNHSIEVVTPPPDSFA